MEEVLAGIREALSNSKLVFYLVILIDCLYEAVIWMFAWIVRTLCPHSQTSGVLPAILEHIFVEINAVMTMH